MIPKVARIIAPSITIILTHQNRCFRNSASTSPSTIKWPTTPTICPKTYCYCEGEVGITKRKLPPAEIKLLRDKIKRRSHLY